MTLQHYQVLHQVQTLKEVTMEQVSTIDIPEFNSDITTDFDFS